MTRDVSANAESLTMQCNVSRVQDDKCDGMDGDIGMKVLVLEDELFDEEVRALDRLKD